MFFLSYGYLWIGGKGLIVKISQILNRHVLNQHIVYYENVQDYLLLAFGSDKMIYNTLL